jgi:N utilization substance protein B
MISRRNIRVKVMQLLYTMETSGEQQLFKDPVAELQKKLDKTRELFIYLLYYITEVVRYAESDSKYRASKHLPNFEDLNVNTKIVGNALLWQILENESYKKALENDKPQHTADKDLIRKIYQQLAETAEYKAYIAEQGREKKADRDIIEFIFNALLLPNETFEEHIEEHFNNWDDDCEMMQQLINNFLQKPNQNIQQIVTVEKWIFAKSLLTSMIDKKEYALELIKPKLKNWDSERIALLDMLLMQMGVCELLYFETIPTKVTINEYIDLAKDYSTPQSGQFVNGILDSLHKELTASEKINKIDFKKKFN